MTAEQFWTEFEELFNENNNFISKARNCWKNRADFTKIIIPKLSSILEKYQYEKYAQYEYYNIDLIGWKNRKSEQLATPPKTKDYKLKKHFWYLGVAVEHENDQTDWTDELVKLLYINCPLRVVIGYYPEELSKENLNEITRYAAILIDSANANQALVTEKQQYLLILGKNHSNPDNLNKNSYTPYIYKNGIFIDLREERK